MELNIIWSEQAAKGYSEILKYVDDNWTKKEVDRFEFEVRAFFDKLKKYPHLLQEVTTEGVRRGPINKHTILTYKVDFEKSQLQVVNMRAAKQDPVE